MKSEVDPLPASVRAEFLAGVRAELPIILGVIPFGMIYGVLAISAGLPATLAQAMSFIVFAGSAQFIGAGLFAAATPALVILLTTAVINLRHVLYSASLAPYVSHLPARWKWLLAYLLTDEAYAVTVIHYAEDPGPLTHKHWFFFGSGLALWASWQASTAVGIFLGAAVPEGAGLDFALALTFIGIIVPTLKDRPHVAASLVAGVVAVLAAALPYRLGLMTGALAGITAGVVLDKRARPPAVAIMGDEELGA